MNDRLQAELRSGEVEPGDLSPASPGRPTVETTSAEYSRRWHRLVSTTNWEKGRIICEWRQAVLDAGSPPGDCSDEAWARRVGQVSAQHVGRLRRVYQRFGAVFQQYAGLYWTHFHAALDWPDAEMWLEGAVQDGWSVAQMRRHRRRVLAASAHRGAGEEPAAVAGSGQSPARAAEAPVPETISESSSVVRDLEGTSLGPSEAGIHASVQPARRVPAEAFAYPAAVEALKPFARLSALPEDLDQAVESLKLAILRHKFSGWREVPQGDVLAALAALRHLAVAPTGD